MNMVSIHGVDSHGSRGSPASKESVGTQTLVVRDPVTLRPERFKVLRENDRVRVVEYRNSPGGRQTVHSHPDGVVHYLNDSKSKQIYPNGTTKETKHKVGDVAWRAAVIHATDNIGVGEYVVERVKALHRTNAPTIIF